MSRTKKASVVENPIYACITTNDDVSIAEVEISGEITSGVEVNVFASGSAKRDPSDSPVRAIGAQLALGRALVRLGRQLISDANAEVVAADKRRRAESQSKVRERMQRRRNERRRQRRNTAVKLFDALASGDQPGAVPVPPQLSEFGQPVS